MCDEVAQRVHRSMYAATRSMLEWLPLSRFLFARDSIFLEPDVGCVLRETVFGRDHACRRKFGSDSADKKKTDIEGAWRTDGLVFRFRCGRWE